MGFSDKELPHRPHSGFSPRMREVLAQLKEKHGGYASFMPLDGFKQSVALGLANAHLPTDKVAPVLNKIMSIIQNIPLDQRQPDEPTIVAGLDKDQIIKLVTTSLSENGVNESLQPGVRIAIWQQLQKSSDRIYKEILRDSPCP